VSSPGKFLQGQYFLTNQQFDFKRRILEHLKKEKHPVIAIAGIAGTGKTLLVFDLAMELSRKNRVLILHAGLLRKGHFEISDRLRNVDIYSFDEITPRQDISGYSYVIIDEAGFIPQEKLKLFLEDMERAGMPLIMTYDPHDLLSEISRDTQQEQRLAQITNASTLLLVFSGHIRINRPVFSFLRTLLYLRDRSGHNVYDCIETLYARDQAECRLIIRHYEKNGVQPDQEQYSAADQ
jgi:DNA replication protein DnaC